MEAAIDAAKQADAVIVGSAVVKRIAEGKLAEACEFINSLRSALDENYSK